MSLKLPQCRSIESATNERADVDPLCAAQEREEKQTNSQRTTADDEIADNAQKLLQVYSERVNCAEQGERREEECRSSSSPFANNEQDTNTRSSFLASLLTNKRTLEHLIQLSHERFRTFVQDGSLVISD